MFDELYRCVGLMIRIYQLIYGRMINCLGVWKVYILGSFCQIFVFFVKFEVVGDGKSLLVFCEFDFSFGDCLLVYLI